MAANLDAAFPDALHVAAQTLGVSDGAFLLVLYAESRLDPFAHRPGSNFWGIAQTNTADVQRLSGTSAADYLTWSASEQLSRVVMEWYVAAAAPLGHPPSSPGALWAINLAPTPATTPGTGDSPTTVLYAAPSKEYNANAALDVNGDGVITVADVDAFMYRLSKEQPFRAALATMPDSTDPYTNGPIPDPSMTLGTNGGRILQAGLLGTGIAAAATIGLLELVKHLHHGGAVRHRAAAPARRTARRNPVHAHDRHLYVALGAGAVAIAAGAAAFALSRSSAGNGNNVTIPPGSLRVFPILDGPSSNIHFRDDFGEPRTGGRKHQGNDLFATEGTAILAPEDGIVTFTDDGQPGGPGAPPPLSFHFQGVSGNFYFGTHLASFEGGGLGDALHVVAGEEIGTVGHGGNAAGTPSHLHFELHRGGTAIDPYPYLTSAARLTDAIVVASVAAALPNNVNANNANDASAALPDDDGRYVKGLLSS